MDTEKQYVCVDIETTGLNHEVDEIVEISARRFKTNGTRGKEFYQLCKPKTGVIPAEATTIHGISSKEVENSPNYLLDGVQQALADFIGDRTVIGHGIHDFDLKFLKIKPKESEDTLEMCRAKYSGGNKLSKACIREGISFDKTKAHGASYDVDRTIELYLKLKGLPQSDSVQQDIFEQPMVSQLKIQDVFTQPYSFSRISLYHQCPFKWKKRYIDKIYEPKEAPLITGTVCHEIAQAASLWCYRETFANKFILYIKIKPIIKFGQDLTIGAQEYYNKNSVTLKETGYYLFENPKSIKTYTGFEGLSHFINEMDNVIGDNEYEKVSMPDLDTFNNMISSALRNNKVTDPDIIRDVELIMLKFYNSKDFSNEFGQIALVEKKLAFDKDWKYTDDWKSPDVFFRGILDIIEYHPNFVKVTDYKTSRTMMNPEQLKRDMQLKIYLLLLFKFLPFGSIKKAIVSTEYLRFGKALEYEIEDIEQMAKEAIQWINDSIMDIEKELLKDPKDAFKPRRNEYCFCCYLGDNNICPLFNRKHINNISDIETFEVKTKEDCTTAWKRVETNKKEIKNLTEKCKTFIKNSDAKVIIDEKAKLDNYAKEIREYDAEKVIPLLLKKGIKLSDMAPYFGINATNVDKLINKNKLQLTEQEYNQISHLKIRHDFDALTDEEARADYLNA